MKKYLIPFVLAVMLLAVLIGCKNLNSPPNLAEVEAQYEAHSADIQRITEFLSVSDHEDIYISDTSGTMLADMERVHIEDKDIVDAVRRLLDNGGYRHISKRGNTISLLQWTGLRDIGCGIACSIQKADTPEVEFVTELIPMYVDGWYYYVSDYETWRNAQ